ncbi:MAG: hypothetical protein ACE5E7_03035 [Anaerolineae bacterium]
MPIFIIAVVIVVITVFAGIVLAFVVGRFEQAVQEVQTVEEKSNATYNPAVTLGHKINLQADVEEQLKEARRLAAKRAAALPRGANMRIGRLGQVHLKTASEALEEDPITAVKIAAFHGWDGAKIGPITTVAAPAPATAAPAARVVGGKIKLVPGKDYPFIEITDGMSPEEKRKARVANAKAKSAALKAAKAAQQAGGGAELPAATTPAAAAAPAVAAPAPVGLPDPPQLIEITDDMSPEEKRKARVANAKAKSAYNKALKAAGLDPKAVAAGKTVAVAAPAATAVAAAPTPAPAAPAPEAAPLPANVPEPPQLIEISDDMSPDEKRRARIANAKAKSAYKKALKEAGIDPKTVKI